MCNQQCTCYSFAVISFVGLCDDSALNSIHAIPALRFVGFFEMMHVQNVCGEVEMW